ncbi:nuclease-related domain-containing DEAD/DEAH box helicase [Ornithinimicrobium sp. INDO-MA30-4]|uniref:nuclease-related domain-containing DEAD/DEAH box helicase n=1 Tax=Ornithinimicrobium sp. INDO-MA30-4 TaxID=2908651 RepID=UPI001F4085C2|nr:NERD domain-containing protein [Ornithinimicrobium sp. INDO-MA30-4]UJH69969.1 NERD domain-containing protein [Ornithinimicrobium sp. INDO-MA30-4]
MAFSLIHMHPQSDNDPIFTNDTERKVWRKVVQAVDSDDVILANVRLTDETKDHEVDLLVLMPDVGIVVVEVKGGSISVDDGRWWQSGGSSRHEIYPVDQARDSKYAVRHYIENDPRWRDSSRTRVRWAHCVVTPYTDIADDFSTPDCPRWAIHGRTDMDTLTPRIRDCALRQEGGQRVPDIDDIELIAEILKGRYLPTPNVAAEADEREAVSDRLTQEQALLLKVTRLLRRVEVRGGAGSGKTVLALTQVKDLARGANDRPTERVALLCYSIGLATYLKRQVEQMPRKHRPAFVGTFHELGMQWGAEDGTRDDSNFWEERLPVQMAELAATLDDRHKFDSIVVDEAQDFAETWWSPLLGALRDEDTGGLFVYSDENQRIFDRFGRPPVELVPLVLDHNLRNTKQIAEVFDPLAPMRMRLKGGDGPEVSFIATDPENALGTADDQVEALLDEGWDPAHIALLTTGRRHPQQAELQQDRGQLGYWQSFWDAEDVFYGHVLGCKGLERRAVVLCVNESESRERAKERMYVGLSRATDRLVVVGDPDVVRAMAGESVARRLGL